VALACLAAVSAPMPPPAAAQSGTAEWSAPVNLSHSGAATNPALVVTSNEMVHVIWQDAYAYFAYARFEDGEWTPPAATGLDALFGLTEAERTANLPPPLFLAGTGAFSYAVWLNAEGTLYVSSVRNTEIGNAGAWSGRRAISLSAQAATAAVDARGSLHVAYVRATDSSGRSAGLYYTRSRNNGQDWSTPALVYESAYLRGLDGAQLNLSLATAAAPDAPVVYLAWDVRPRRQVLLARSVDGGLGWEAPRLVDGPTSASAGGGPNRIRVGAAGSSVLLLWQRGEPSGACREVYQASPDAGVNWSEPQLLFESLPGCPRSSEFVRGNQAGPDGWLYLLTKTESQAFLAAWNGSEWSEPQRQPILAGFEDPELFSQVVFDCLRAAWLGSELIVVGCDTGGGGDIWATSRPVASVDEWFVPPVWSQPAAAAGEELEAADLRLVATSDDLVHAFVTRRMDPAIYYTRWDGAAWSRLTAVLSLPEGNARWPSVAVGPKDELLLVARSSTGALYFSRSSSRQAATASSWSPPALLPAAHAAPLSAADLAWDAAGTVHLAYAVPANDERGVYLMRSHDGGKTWDQALPVFDGAAAGFDFVGAPSVQVAGDGSVHVLWARYALEEDAAPRPLSLHYARSDAAGGTFSPAAVVAEAPVGWREIVGDGRGALHRLWQRADMPATLWHQLSTDGGRSWQIAQQLPAEAGAAAVTLDAAGRLHLVNGGLGAVGHWMWDGLRWQAQAPMNWLAAAQPERLLDMLAATVSPDGQMVVLLAPPSDAEDGDQLRRLLYARRGLDAPPREGAAPTPVAPLLLAPTPAPATPALAPTAAPGGLPAVEPAGAAGQEQPASASAPVSAVALGLAPAALLLAAGLGVLAFRVSRAGSGRASSR
jgi:hypothetical protein